MSPTKDHCPTYVSLPFLLSPCLPSEVAGVPERVAAHHHLRVLRRQRPGLQGSPDFVIPADLLWPFQGDRGHRALQVDDAQIAGIVESQDLERASGTCLRLLARRQGQTSRSAGRPRRTLSGSLLSTWTTRWPTAGSRCATRFLAGQAGLRQFLDIGSGFPTSPNVHEIAEGGRVVYVDNDPMAYAHA